MAKFAIRALLSVTFIWAALGGAQAAKRVALVVGNSAYQHVTALPNSTNDAADLAAALERLDFSVRREVDLSYDGLRQALRAFGDVARGAEMAVVFFAGHGMELDRQNFLIPVDAQLRTDQDVPFETIPLDHVMTALGGAAGLKLALPTGTP